MKFIDPLSAIEYDRTPKGYHQWPDALVKLTQSCAGDTHIFGCQHAEKCKCGKATRTVEPRICQHCKKAHD